MMKYLKRLSALLIALAIFFTAIPVSAFYEDDEAVTLNEVQETDYSSAENVDMSFELLILPQYESGTTYSFTYDGFARNVSTKVGSRTLSSYTYNARSLPQTMTYGNGVVVSYGYDNLNRQTEFYVNNWLKYEYNYDGYSRLSELVDYSLHRKMKYEYDILSRPASEKVIDAFTNYIVSKLSLRYDDSKNRLAGYDVTIGGTTNSTDYTYGGTGIAPDLITGVNRNGIRKISYIYDGLNRLSTRNLNNFFTEYTYLQGATSNSTTTLVESVKNGDETLSYTYDDLGNITSISKNGTLIESYTYNDLNMLKTVTKDNDVYTYTYDGGGNIKSVKKNGTTVKTYTYGDSQWKDLLTAYNGQTITYDNIGNPLTYYNGSTFTWGNGRKLTNITNGTNTYSYQYDSNGLRTTKTVNGTTTEYYWLDGMLYAQKTGNKYIYFHYDENGTAYGFTVKEGTTSADYYYMHNLQGDVIGIFDSVGEDTIVRYTYDEWGKILSITGDQANTIGQLNPIRYRGYYYDTESGFYYCQSRYYDPETGRFINGDGYISTGQGVYSKNLYSYCLNNSINYSDILGTKCICLTQRVNFRHKCKSTNSSMPTLPKEKESPPLPKLKMIYPGVLSEDNKVLIATIAAEATVTANNQNVSWQGRQAMANVALNRVGSREWSRYNTVSEICQFTGFDGYGNKNYRACMEYLNNRDGQNLLYEEIVWDTMAAYRNDITNGCQLYFTPAAMIPPGSVPRGWNFGLLEEVYISGVDSYYEGRFYRYK